jgi:hypothetical protein
VTGFCEHGNEPLRLANGELTVCQYVSRNSALCGWLSVCVAVGGSVALCSVCVQFIDCCSGAVCSVSVCSL